MLNSENISHVPWLMYSMSYIFHLSVIGIICVFLSEVYVKLKRRSLYYGWNNFKENDRWFYTKDYPLVQITGGFINHGASPISIAYSNFDYTNIYDQDGTLSMAYYTPNDYIKIRDSGHSSTLLRSISSKILSADSMTEKTIGIPKWLGEGLKGKSGYDSYTMSVRDLQGIDAQGCEMISLMNDFPTTKRSILLRYLIAAKGDSKKARDTYKNALIWRENHIPPQREIVAPIYKSKAYLACGTARDSSPVFYFRGAYYDPALGTAEQYIVAMAYAVDRMIEISPTGTVTVIVHAAPCKDAPNTPVDRELINCFIHLVTTIFPQRLENFILFPFPWWARAIWAFSAMFLDQETQQRVHLLPCSDFKSCPEDLFKWVDREDVPEVLGGGCDLENEDILKSKTLNFTDLLDAEITVLNNLPMNEYGNLVVEEDEVGIGNNKGSNFNRRRSRSSGSSDSEVIDANTIRSSNSIEEEDPQDIYGS